MTRLSAEKASKQSRQLLDIESDSTQDVIFLLRSLSRRTKCYFWRLDGDEENSLRRLLRITEDELRDILVELGVYDKIHSKFKRNKLEELVKKVGRPIQILDYTLKSATKRKKVLLLQLGELSEKALSTKPGDQYDGGRW